MERRDFLKLVAASGLGFAASQSPLRRLVATKPLEPRLVAYEESFRKAACTLCPAGCGLEVRLVNGHVVGLRGNPWDPRTGGGLCPKGLSLLQQLYHPDRLKKPLRRSGPKGGDRWEVVEWDEALEAIGRELARLRGEAPEGIVFLDGRPFGLMHRLVDRWTKFLGTPHHLADHYLDAFPVATRLMMGRDLRPACDLGELDLVVSVGDAFLDYALSPVSRAREYARFRGREGERRGELVVFDDGHGITAEKADQFYRIEPGRYAAILLGLANVLVRYEWYDRDFVDEHSRGLEEWQRRVLGRYPPEVVEELTGVPSTVLYDVAGRLSRAERKVVLAGPPAVSGPGGLHTAMAMLAVNALLGSIDRDLHMNEPIEAVVDLGPLPVEPSSPTGERLDRERFPLAVDAPWILPAILRKRPEAVRALFLYYSNPVASHFGGEAWREALSAIPLVVSFSPFLDESSSYADWILPDSLGLERYQEIAHPPVSGALSLSVTQPMWDEPLYDTRHTGDVLLDLARAASPGEAEAWFPWADYVELMEQGLRQLYRLKSGTLFLPPEKMVSFVELARRGYWSSDVEDEEAFLDGIYERGGFVLPVYVPGQWGRLFQTASGRFEFVSEALRETIEGYIEREGATLADLGLAGIAETYPMPELAADVPAEGPLGKVAWLVTWSTGGTAELPWWWETVGMHRSLQWTIWAEGGTDDAAKARLDRPRRPEVRLRLGGKEHRMPLVWRFGGHPRVWVLPAGFGRRLVRTTPLPGGIDVLAEAGYRPDPLTGLPAYYFPLESVVTEDEEDES